MRQFQGLDRASKTVFGIQDWAAYLPLPWIYLSSLKTHRGRHLGNIWIQVRNSWVEHNKITGSVMLNASMNCEVWIEIRWQKVRQIIKHKFLSSHLFPQFILIFFFTRLFLSWSLSLASLVELLDVLLAAHIIFLFMLHVP